MTMPRIPKFTDPDLLLLWCEKRIPDVEADLDAGVLRPRFETIGARWMSKMIGDAIAASLESSYINGDTGP